MAQQRRNTSEETLENTRNGGYDDAERRGEDAVREGQEAVRSGEVAREDLGDVDERDLDPDSASSDIDRDDSVAD